MSWIREINYAESEGKLKKLYNRVKGPEDTIDHVLQVHSLRPHTLDGHMHLYKSVLHHTENTLPKYYLELIGCYVSHLNACDYCFIHHTEGVRKNMPADGNLDNLIAAITEESYSASLGPSYAKGLTYVKHLTLHPATIKESYIEELRMAGLTDGEILEINQVASYFNYVNRTVLGLGVQLEKTNIGMSPSSDSDNNWNHA